MVLTRLRAVIIVALAAPLTLSAAVAVASEAPDWSFEGESGPDHWGELDPSFAACADGTTQSPIDITVVAVADLGAPEFSYAPGPVTIVDNGYQVQAVPAAGNTVTVDGNTSSLLQMHFHNPSDHTINGQTAAAEAHFVHEDADSALTVVGLLLEEGAEDNASWAPYIDALGTEAGADGAVTLDWASMLPAIHTSFRYDGSLTTPPCAEGVTWVLMQEPVVLGAGQITALTAAYEGNSRPVQPLNDRTVTLDWRPAD